MKWIIIFNLFALLRTAICAPPSDQPLEKEKLNPPTSESGPALVSPIKAQQTQELERKVESFGGTLNKAKENPLDDQKRERLNFEFQELLKKNNKYVEGYKKGELDIRQAPMAQAMLARTMDRYGLPQESMKAAPQRSVNVQPARIASNYGSSTNRTYLSDKGFPQKSLNTYFERPKKEEIRKELAPFFPEGNESEPISKNSDSEKESSVKIASIGGGSMGSSILPDAVQLDSGFFKLDSEIDGEHPATDALLSTLSETLSNDIALQALPQSAEEEASEEFTNLLKAKKRKIKNSKEETDALLNKNFIDKSQTKPIKASTGSLESPLFNNSIFHIFLLLLVMLALSLMIIRKIS